jgi:hypothetical protein
MPYDAGNPTTFGPAAPWLKGRAFASWREEFDCRGYLIFERVLAPNSVAELRAALTPFLARDLTGRNDFEGLKTNRVYALLAKCLFSRSLRFIPWRWLLPKPSSDKAACCRPCSRSICIRVKPCSPGILTMAAPRAAAASGARRQRVLGDRRHD